ncbi:MAG TPA: serine--tRNA ligase, partial [Acidimicrobiales bacterium]|nr:serine--tRNA ligase [Acidimicrobiales bacterium]
MIDIRLVREDRAAVASSLGRRGVDADEVEKLYQADNRTRAAVGRRDEVRAQIKDLSRQVGEARRAGDQKLADELSERSRVLGDEEKALEAEAEDAQGEVRRLLLWLPNLPADDAPDGTGAEDNPVVRR